MKNKFLVEEKKNPHQTSQIIMDGVGWGMLTFALLKLHQYGAMCYTGAWKRRENAASKQHKGAEVVFKVLCSDFILI